MRRRKRYAVVFRASTTGNSDTPGVVNNLHITIRYAPIEDHDNLETVLAKVAQLNWLHVGPMVLAEPFAKVVEAALRSHERVLMVEGVPA